MASCKLCSAAWASQVEHEILSCESSKWRLQHHKCYNGIDSNTNTMFMTQEKYAISDTWFCEQILPFEFTQVKDLRKKKEKIFCSDTISCFILESGRNKNLSLFCKQKNVQRLMTWWIAEPTLLLMLEIQSWLVEVVCVSCFASFSNHNEGFMFFF